MGEYSRRRAYYRRLKRKRCDATIRRRFSTCAICILGLIALSVIDRQMQSAYFVLRIYTLSRTQQQLHFNPQETLQSHRDQKQ